jgi:hypothetical protein
MAQRILSDTANLSVGQFMIVAALGIVLWFIAAILLRLVGPLGAFDGINRALLYLAIVPGTVPFVFLIRWAAGLKKTQTALGCALVTGAALISDGLAFAYWPTLYGSTQEHIMAASAAVLWGGGVAILLGFLFNRSS